MHATCTKVPNCLQLDGIPFLATHTPVNLSQMPDLSGQAAVRALESRGRYGADTNNDASSTLHSPIISGGDFLIHAICNNIHSPCSLVVSHSWQHIPVLTEPNA